MQRKKLSLLGVNTFEQLDYIIEQAILLKASDIHIDLKEDGAILRIRAGGRLSFDTNIPREIAHAIIGRLKLLSGMRLDISDKSQDGSCMYKIDHIRTFHPEVGQGIHIRLGTAPTVFGENIVCRLFAFQGSKGFSLSSLGLEYQDELILKKSLNFSSGLILVSGPTGSGKTTTLYACLEHLSKQARIIVTLEDPVEVILPNIRQIKVQDEYGFSFADALKGVLRQDPDVIMVGEIRDSKTAELAVQAALTGHLILATIHAPSALEIIDRLHSLGIKSEICASVITLLISQRQISVLGGRKCVFELVEFNFQLKSKLLLASNSSALSETIRSQGILLLKDRVEGLFHEGLISREEMYKYIR